MSEENCWSQCVYLAVEEPNMTLQSLNMSLMNQFGMKPGFQAPCQKPHLSLLYGNFSTELKKEAQNTVQDEFGNEIFQTVFEMDQIELWNTGGGLDGVHKWKQLVQMSL